MTDLQTVLDAFVEQTHGDGFISDEMLVFPIYDGYVVRAAVQYRHGTTRWFADVESVLNTAWGPAPDAPVQVVVDWLREVCHALPDVEPRSFVVGLPVVITVNSDGSIAVDVDLSEADDIETEDEGIDLDLYARHIRSAILHEKVSQ